MIRIQTSPASEDSKDFLKAKFGIVARNMKQRYSTESYKTIDASLMTLTQCLRNQSRLCSNQKKTRKNGKNGLLTESLQKFIRERLKNPVYQKSIKSKNLSKHQTACRTPRFSTDCKASYGYRLHTDMNETQQMKNKILKTLESNEETKDPTISNESFKIKSVNTIQNEQDKPCGINVMSEIALIREYLQTKIDGISEILDRVSVLMAKHKINFRNTLFLCYKLFFIRRTQQTQKIHALYRKKEEKCHIELDQVQQNKNIQQCLETLLKKLQTSKKWPETPHKEIFENQLLNQNEKKCLIKLVLQQGFKNFDKIAKIMDKSVQNNKNLYDFGAGLLTLVKEDMNNTA